MFILFYEVFILILRYLTEQVFYQNVHLERNFDCRPQQILYE